MKKQQKILVTGAAGFIGFHLSRKLLSEGWQIIGLDNINDYYNVQLKYDRLSELGIAKEEVRDNTLIASKSNAYFSFIKMNLEDAHSMQQMFVDHGFDVVCHLAAQAGVRYSLENPMAYINSNIVGFTNILECSRLYKIKHLVYASSSSVYGLNTKMPFSTHDSVNHPVSLYAATKKSNELMAHVYSQLYDLPTTGLRFFTVYGPWGRPDMSPMLFADAIMKGETLKVFNQGNMSRDFTYVDDVVEGVLRVISCPATTSDCWNSENPDPATSMAPYQIFNIGSSAPVRLLDYIETLEEALGKTGKKAMLPMQPGDVVATYCDVSDLENEFDYRPQTSLKTGIGVFAKWYQAYYGL